MVANALGDRVDDLDTRVEFVAFGAEEVGLDGSKHHADAVDPETVRAVVNLDGVVRGRTLKAWTHEFDTLDKLDVRNLREQAFVLTELAVELAADDLTVEHASPDEVAAAFERTGRDEELKTGDEWPEAWPED